MPGSSFSFSFQGSLDASTRSNMLALPQACQNISVQGTVSQILGTYSLGALGTTLEIEVQSTNPGVGFGPDPILQIQFATYPGVAQGQNGLAGIDVIASINSEPPSSGSATGSVTVGNPPPGKEIDFSFLAYCSTESINTSTGEVLGSILVQAEAVDPIWQTIPFPQNQPINDIAALVVSNDEGIDITYSITGTGYVGSSSGGTTVTGGEQLILDEVSPALGDTIPLAGVNLGMLATGLQVAQDNGSWAVVGDFASGIGWSGNSGTVLAQLGTHVLQVRDSNNTTVTSNYVTYTLQPPSDTACCEPNPSAPLGRYRGAVGLTWRTKAIIGDAFSGVIGLCDLNTTQEYGNTIECVVTVPIIHEDRRRVFVPRFEIDVESGVGQPECCGFDPVWMLDWSKDGGRTWGPVQSFRSMGKIGQYRQRLRWLRLGQARQWIFRLRSTDPVRRVIIGTYADFYAGMGGS